MLPSSAKSTFPASTQAMARYEDLKHRQNNIQLPKAYHTDTSSPTTGRPRQAPQHSKLETRLHHGDRAHRDSTIHGRSRQQEAAAASRGHQLLSKRPCEEVECVDREGTRNRSSQINEPHATAWTLLPRQRRHMTITTSLGYSIASAHLKEQKLGASI